MSKFFIPVLVLFSFSTIISCSKKSENNNDGRNTQVVELKDVATTKEQKTFSLKNSNVIVKRSEDRNNLEISLDKDFFSNKNLLFGAVITKIDNPTDEYFGDLKLSNITAAVKSEVTNGKIEFSGCTNDCTELSETKVVLTLPVREVDTNNNITVDFSNFSEIKDVIATYQSNWNYPSEKWSLQSSYVDRIEVDNDTVLADVISTYQIEFKKDESTTELKKANLTTRFFLRFNSVLDARFQPRKPTHEVGFFTTNTRKENYINRFSLSDTKEKPVKYYLKNIPQEHRSAFSEAFNQWNTKMKPLFGHDFLTHEYLETNDPRFNNIVTGDPRYNVIEWDLENLAGYGGLGPSLAHEASGQILAAQVLIQGPAVEKLYKEWFKVKSDSQNLKAQGLLSKASQLENAFVKKLTAAKKDFSVKNNINLGALNFFIPGQDPRLHDPIFAMTRMDFLDTPANVSYEQYMYGYFVEMVAHEVGHNLGLRHNFKGSLSDDGSDQIGTASRSVMEYTTRLKRWINRVGDYDVMALAYGYLGASPEHSDWYCTDEDSVSTDPNTSPECSSSDATNDPFSFLEERLGRVANKLLALGQPDVKPDWTMTEIKDGSGFTGWLTQLTAFATSAENTATSWTTFFGKLDRPNKENISEVPTYVIKRINNILCSEDYAKDIQAKISIDARYKATKNLSDFRKESANVLSKFTKPQTILTKENFPCLFAE